MTTQLKFYVTLDVPSDVFSDDNLNATYEFVRESVQEIAEGLQGSVYDLELK